MKKETQKKLAFRDIIETDIPKLTTIMKDSFDNDTSMHTDLKEGGPSGYNNGELLIKLFKKKDLYGQKILLNYEVIGAFFVIDETHECNLDLLFIDPQYHSKGIGYKVWLKIESLFPKVKIWKTATPGYSKRNHNFYINKCGFKVYKITGSFTKYDECYHMEKSS